MTDLKRLNPDFVSVTWGAGGSTRDQLTETLDRLDAAGVENVLALGGDWPPDYRPPPGGFVYANELTAFIRSRWGFCLGGACYPETHRAAPSPETDLENLVRKVNAGSDFLITQLFFDNADYFAFVERARDAGIGVPIVPGIMPIISAASARRMNSLGGGRMPPELERSLADVEHDDALTMQVGVEWATLQCRELRERGVPGIHFYTLNKSLATRSIFQSLLEG